MTLRDLKEDCFSHDCFVKRDKEHCDQSGWSSPRKLNHKCRIQRGPNLL